MCFGTLNVADVDVTSLSRPFNWPLVFMHAPTLDDDI
jgi:hypothetical protein